LRRIGGRFVRACAELDTAELGGSERAERTEHERATETAGLVPSRRSRQRTKEGGAARGEKQAAARNAGGAQQRKRSTSRRREKHTEKEKERDRDRRKRRSHGQTRRVSDESNTRMPTAGKDMKTAVVFVSTEVAPWSKVGGLADVVAALPKALVGLEGVGKVMSVSPMYEAYDGVGGCGVSVALPDVVVDGFVDDGGGGGEREEEGATAEGELERGREGAGEGEGEGEGGPGSVFGEASLYSTTQDGVERVFVRHPLLDMHRVVTRQDLKNEHPSFTYVDADGGVYDCRNMAVRYDIMAWGALMAAAQLGGNPSSRSSSSSSLSSLSSSSRHDKVVFVLNDWPTALVLVRLRQIMAKAAGAPDTLTSAERQIADGLGQVDVNTVFCIHNLAYQGVFSAEAVGRDLGLGAAAMVPLLTRVPWEQVVSAGSAGSFEAFEAFKAFESLELEAEDEVNFLRGALLLADRVLTVSPHYAVEIASENDDFSCGMGEILRHKQVQGIMNGIDVDEWDPETDALLPDDCRYNAYTVFRGKNSMKRRLQARLGLEVDDSVLFVFIGRLTEQKGVDTLLRAATRLLPKKPAPVPVELAGGGADGAAGATGANETTDVTAAVGRLSIKTTTPSRNKSKRKFKPKMSPVAPQPTSTIQLAVLGTGDQWLEQAVSSLELNFPGTATGVCEFSEELAHWMLAAADYCLIPSKFEPCGLIAQCAARYGAVPIMTATGGLKNLGDAGVGILLPRSETVQESVDDLVAAMKAAVDEHGSDSHCNQRALGMKYDFSWNVHAREWQALLLEGDVARRDAT